MSKKRCSSKCFLIHHQVIEPHLMCPRKPSSHQQLLLKVWGEETRSSINRKKRKVRQQHNNPQLQQQGEQQIMIIVTRFPTWQKHCSPKYWTLKEDVASVVVDAVFKAAAKEKRKQLLLSLSSCDTFTTSFWGRRKKKQGKNDCFWGSANDASSESCSF